MSVVLFGAGGHAKMLVEILQKSGEKIVLYCDPNTAEWLYDIPHSRVDTEASPEMGDAVIGRGGVTPDGLRDRLSGVLEVMEMGFVLRTIVHASAIRSDSAEIGAGSHVLAGSIVQPFSRIGTASIINSGAIVEHDCRIGDGSHIGPGAIVLGGAQIGDNVMVGARAVVLPQAVVPDGTLVPAGRTWS
ncbi:MAG: hypothetical protein R8L07_12430 [Alphaproteobacteria bacterium]|nr:hypothetical protein [Alphaproteobacteria bacterium]